MATATQSQPQLSEHQQAAGKDSNTGVHTLAASPMQKEAEQQPPTSSLSSKNQIYKTNPQAQTISGGASGIANRFISGPADTANTTVRLRTAAGVQKPMAFGNQASFTNKSSYNTNDVKRRSSYAVANSFRPTQ